MQRIYVSRLSISRVYLQSRVRWYSASEVDITHRLFPNRFAKEEIEHKTIYTNKLDKNNRIKISGLHTREAFNKLTGLDLENQSEIQVSRWNAYQIEDDSKRADALVVYFPALYSETGQDYMEIYLHGKKKELESANSLLVQQIRKIGPQFTSTLEDEFLERGFKKGKISLNSFDIVGDALSKTDQRAMQRMLREHGLGLGGFYAALHEKLEWSYLLSKAKLRFKNQEDLLEVSKFRDMFLVDILKKVRRILKSHKLDDRRDFLARNCMQLPIIGPPNAGKSSLLNKFAQTMVSQVSPVKGSTQSVKSCKINIDGYPVVFSDTVGLENDKNAKLDETLSRMDSSDLKLCMLDIEKLYKNKSSHAIDEKVLKEVDSDTILLLNKRDLINIRIPELPAKTRFKQAPLSPQGPEVIRRAFKGRIPVRQEDDTAGMEIEFGEYGLRMMQDAKLTENCLQEVRSTLHRHIKDVKGGRFWLKVTPNHPLTSKPLGVRMGKGKGTFDHWEAKVPYKTILCEIGGGVRKELAEQAFKAVSSRVPGKTEFVSSDTDETENQLIERVKAYFNVEPLGVWVISCETGQGIGGFLKDLVEILKSRYPSNAQNPAIDPVNSRLQTLDLCIQNLDSCIKTIQRTPNQLEEIRTSISNINSTLSRIINPVQVDNIKSFMYHSRYGILKRNDELRELITQIRS